MAPTTVDSDAIKQAAQRIEQGKTEIAQGAQNAITSFSSLSSSWTGDAGSKFQTVVMQSLQPTFEKIKQQLTKMEQDVLQAGNVYTKSGAYVVDAVHDLGNGLPGV